MSPNTWYEKSKEEFKHVDPFVDSIKPLTLACTKSLSNLKYGTIFLWDICKNTSSMSSSVDWNVISGQIRHSSDCKKSYPIKYVF